MTEPATRRLTLYGKPGCHLCDVAHPIVERVAHDAGLTVHEQSIVNDPAAFAAYRYRIPVVALGNDILDEGNVDERRLRTALRRLLAKTRA